MNPRSRCWFWSVSICLFATALPVAAENIVLARVDCPGSPATFPLPIHAHLQDAAGLDYVLVKATASVLAQSGWSHQILDPTTADAAYLLAFERRPGARQAARNDFQILHDDGRRLLIRSTSDQDIDRLSALGFQCRPLPAEPLRFFPAPALDPGPPKSAAFSNAAVASMMAQIRQTNLVRMLGDLTGTRSVTAGGSTAPIRTRHQDSGTPLWRATALAHERFAALGLQPRFEPWTAGSRSSRNVVATQPGTGRATEIVVLCAHIDNMPATGDAPGADDNASGSVAVLAAAEVLRAQTYERTLRFILFTGEEQGLLGSDAHARAARAAGERIVAVLNLDMIAYRQRRRRRAASLCPPGLRSGPRRRPRHRRHLHQRRPHLWTPRPRPPDHCGGGRLERPLLLQGTRFFLHLRHRG
jgi:hypothetical protein